MIFFRVCFHNRRVEVSGWSLLLSQQLFSFLETCSSLCSGPRKCSHGTSLIQKTRFTAVVMNTALATKMILTAYSHKKWAFREYLNLNVLIPQHKIKRSNEHKNPCFVLLFIMEHTLYLKLCFNLKVWKKCWFCPSLYYHNIVWTFLLRRWVCFYNGWSYPQKLFNIFQNYWRNSQVDFANWSEVKSVINPKSKEFH